MFIVDLRGPLYKLNFGQVKGEKLIFINEEGI